MNSLNPKILIIGIDGGTWKILDDAIEQGFMPYLQKLIKEGAYGSVSSTIPPISPSAWGTIQTGKDALKNHVYDFYSFNKITKELKIVNSTFLKNTIWDILSSVGKKVAAVNVPMTYPPRKVNGFIISGILTPSINSDFIYPPELKHKILEKVPNYQLKYTDEKRYGNPIANMENFVNQRIKNLKDRTKVCLFLLYNYKLDILMVNFQANDILQHSLWGYIERDHVLYNNKIREYIFNNFHRTLDFCIETLVEESKKILGGDLLTMIISDHGFESHIKQFYLGDWLYRNKLLIIKTGSIKTFFRKKIVEFIEKMRLQRYLAIIFKILKNLINKINIFKSRDARIKYMRNIIDMEKSKVYSTGIGLYGSIFIFAEGTTREKYIKILKKKLLDLRDPKTNSPFIKNIFMKEEVYDGDQPNLIPDLIIQPINGYSLTGMYKGKKHLLEKINIKESESIGKHNDKGIIILNSPSVLKKKIDGATLKDIVPTILNYFGLPISKEIEGNVLDCFKGED